MIPLLLALLAGFLLGSVPTGYLVAKSRGIDIRQHGSGNIGATNVLRTLGKGPGYFVFVGDFLKGAFSVLIAGWIAARFQGSGDWARILGGIGCILGHNFTPWLGFKGGKGVATSAGVLLALFNPLVLLAVLAVWLIVFWVSRYVSLASICTGIALPFCVLIAMTFGWGSLPDFIFSVIVAALLVLRHKTNIQRLLAGTESRFEKKPKDSSVK
ncbi:MAG TPA: glycerol-3-phosphate 1-O-acyltransferase PlsY [Chthoniobacterales bacterium]